MGGYASNIKTETVTTTNETENNDIEINYDNQNEKINNNVNNNYNDISDDHFIVKQNRKKRSKNLKKKNKQKTNKNHNTQSQKRTKQQIQLSDNDHQKNINHKSNVKIPTTINATINNKNVVIKKKYDSHVNNPKYMKLKANANNKKLKPIKIDTIDEIMKQQTADSTNGTNIIETSIVNEEDKSMQCVLLESTIQQTTQNPSLAQNDQNVMAHIDSNTDINANNNVDHVASVNAVGGTDSTTNANANSDTNATNTIAKDIKENREKTINEDYDDQLVDDYFIALVLQQDEANHIKKPLSNMNSNAKHTKVNVTNVSDNFYYNQYNNFNQNNYDNDDNDAYDNEICLETSNFGPSHVVTSRTSLKHDQKVWNKKYVERLNQYVVFGNLNDADAHFNNKSYNSLRNVLDKKGIKKFEGLTQNPAIDYK